ncbi:Crp/Fnr family transcriptional regulator [Halomonas sp. ISL-60]|uniref:Crp/Fnr family transcriptional regulator n=1 Tax=unclassified Halomonas TaxID=2609666 RepID=UPI001BE74E4F|nr:MULTISPECIES: Crp/Fnr family transcriptional regulator [unclassified Halomonas]MBT2774514.1 Crp/Fnr family transcriptional regulator [Halomonas sp. ISL-60]MBT2785873.1 Crp/Fnr family transcriptional regulator [Halomonas sp. ISL-106]MBT2799163.1 Crp/Fnr family transcriptional regulator [Halomonas sp. ISL-104]MBT2800355.1 Crp/Fnr family transcriptional regulator [Halomonas sp. ISL-56]
MNEENSCIIKHFSHYCSLSEEEKNLLLSLEESPSNIKSGSLLWEMGDVAKEFCTLKSGWAYSYRHMENGDRQILEVFLPGDIIGLREFAFSQRLENVRMIDDGVVCHFPHKRMLDIFRQSLPLTSIMFAISSRQQALMTERLVNLARRSARQKMAHYLYEMYLRLRQTNPNISNQFRLPLSQEQLADVLGLSPVHVSRTFTALSEDGLVFRDRHHVTIPDLQALSAEGEFDDCYLTDNVRPLLGDPD